MTATNSRGICSGRRAIFRAGYFTIFVSDAEYTVPHTYLAHKYHVRLPQYTPAEHWQDSSSEDLKRGHQVVPLPLSVWIAIVSQAFVSTLPCSCNHMPLLAVGSWRVPVAPSKPRKVSGQKLRWLNCTLEIRGVFRERCCHIHFPKTDVSIAATADSRSQPGFSGTPASVSVKCHVPGSPSVPGVCGGVGRKHVSRWHPQDFHRIQGAL